MNTETSIDKYYLFCEKHKDEGEAGFFNALAKEFSTTIDVAYNIWYAEQRSWFKPEMIDALIALEKNTDPNKFVPNLICGEFEWDSEKNEFIPEC